ncbi:hypothetical protein [Promicromonospora sp. NPDC023805]|uniref:hypothetical protein n=1 Tax=Promicromonospora sp. NPDC023805 TaxID=3154696 RepID=UPI0033E543BB
MSDETEQTVFPYSQLVMGSLARGAEDEALAAQDEADREWLNTGEQMIQGEQSELDRAVADGKTYAQFRSAVVHTLNCSIVRERFDRMSAWRALLERFGAGEYNATIRPGPTLYHRHELEALPRTRRRCEKCAPDIENWTKPSPSHPGTVITKEIKSVSLAAHHAGRTLILADGSEAGEIEAVHITVTTTGGTYKIGRDASVTLRHVVSK